MSDFYRIIPHRLHVPEKWREMIEEEVVRILDRIDGDPDFEPQGDEEPDNDGEPELGWTEREATTSRYVRDWTTGSIDVNEPSLGSLDASTSGAGRWVAMTMPRSNAKTKARNATMKASTALMSKTNTATFAAAASSARTIQPHTIRNPIHSRRKDHARHSA